MAICCSLLSCKNANRVPLPEDQFGFSQPETVPLKFTAPKKFAWDTIKSDGFHPVVKQLHIEALPSLPFDSSDNYTRPIHAEESRFDFNTLPASNFNLADLPSTALDLQVSLLQPGRPLRTVPPSLIAGKALAIEIYGASNGFPSQFVSTLYKDRSGMLWIGSVEGLFRFDGENLQAFIQGTPNIPAISGITEDHDGNIWFAQLGSLIGKIDLRNRTIGITRKIVPVPNNISKLMTDAAGNVWALDFKDTAIQVINPAAGTYKTIKTGKALGNAIPIQMVQDNKKNIWIAAMENGLKIIDPVAGKMKELKPGNDPGGDFVSALTIDDDGGIWVAARDKVYAIDAEKGIIKKYRGAMDANQMPFVFLLSFDSRGRLWKCNAGPLELFDFKNGTVKYITQKDGLPENQVIAIEQGEHGATWLAGGWGLSKINQYAGAVRKLGDTRVVSLMEDHKRNLWVATNNGVLIVDSARKNMRLLDQAHGLSHNRVQSFTMMGDKMGVATNGGFNIVDPVNHTITIAGKKEGLSQDTIYSIMQDRDGMFWTTGPSEGLTATNISKNEFLSANITSGLSDDNIGDIKQDKNGLIWLATSRGGVDIYDPATSTIKYLNNLPGLSDTCNRVLHVDNENRVWIATDKGVYVADTRNNTITNISTANGLSSNNILSLLPYGNSVVAGTKNQINIITPPSANDADKNWKVSLLEGSQDLKKLTNSWATDCITKSGDYLWGDVGISVIHGINASKDSTIVHVTGMNIMNEPQYFVQQQADTKKEASNSSDSSKQITNAAMHQRGYANSTVYSWDSVKGPYNLPVNLSIPYDNNYLQFQFAELNPGRKDAVFYSYVLEGIDKNWSTPSTNTFTENYLNLPPGHYSFKVVSKGWDGKWSKPASFDFSIAPPWYKTWWAYLLYSILGLSILRAYVVYRSRKLKRENKLLEEKVNIRTQQLQQSIEDLKKTQTQLIQSEKMASLGELTAGIAHEIQNPLNFVNNFSELNTELLQELNEEIAKGNYEEVQAIAKDVIENEQKITHHGKRADAIVKGMLQHSRSSNGIKEPTDINALTDEYLRLSYHGLRAKDKSFNATMKTNFDESLQKINIVSQDVGRVILNLITNAFYAVTEKKKLKANEGMGADFEPTVCVSTASIVLPSGEKGIEVKIEDNGMGVPQKVMDKIFQPFFTTKPVGQGTGLGLSLSYDIIKSHNGVLKVDNNAEGEGATFIIQLPINT